MKLLHFRPPSPLFSGGTKAEMRQKGALPASLCYYCSSSLTRHVGQFYWVAAASGSTVLFWFSPAVAEMACLPTKCNAGSVFVTADSQFGSNVPPEELHLIAPPTLLASVS